MSSLVRSTFDTLREIIRESVGEYAASVVRREAEGTLMGLYSLHVWIPSQNLLRKLVSPMG
jgi:hypothetical protein